MKKIISSIEHVLCYLFYRFIIMGMAIRCWIESWDHDEKKKSLRQDGPFDQIQFLLNLILSEGEILKYSESLSVIYSLSAYTISLIEFLREDGKLSDEDETILNGIADNEILDVNQRVIKLSQYITGM